MPRLTEEEAAAAGLETLAALGALTEALGEATREALTELGALAELCALLACVLGALAFEVLRLATVCELAGLTVTPAL